MSAARQLVFVTSAVLSLLPMSAAARNERPMAPASVVKNAAIDQNLNAQVAPELAFRDEAGRPVTLGQYFGNRPIVLSLVYYRCPGLCTMTLNGMAKAFKPLKLSAGTEFEVVTVSIDPKETPELAAKKKEEYLRQYGRAGAGEGWHFLTGDESAIRALAATVGFRYVYDENTNQYAHSAGIMVLTPTGKVARYFYGLEYSSRDLRWALVEASENRIGSVSDTLNLLCYEYDPTTGKYGVPIMRTIRGAAVLTMLCLGGFIVTMLRRDHKLGAARQLQAGGPAS